MKARDLMALPEDKTQCVHASYLGFDGSVLRCTKTANKGWLCEQHDHELLTKPLVPDFAMHPVVVTDHRDRRAAEIVASILATEKRALRDSARETTGVGRMVLHTVAGVRLSPMADLPDHMLTE